MIPEFQGSPPATAFINGGGPCLWISDYWFAKDESIVMAESFSYVVTPRGGSTSRRSTRPSSSFASDSAYRRYWSPGRHMATFVLIPGAGGLAWEWHRLEPRARGARPHSRPDRPARRRRRVGARRVRRLDGARDRRTDRRRARRPVVRRVYGTTRLRTGPRRPDRPPERDDPEAGRDVRRVVVEHRPGRAKREYAATLGLTPPISRTTASSTTTTFRRRWSRRRSSSIRSSRARRSVSRGPSTAGRTSRRVCCPAATTACSPRTFQRRVAQERLGITPDTVPGGHMVALSNPAGLADWLDRYAATDLRPA